MQNVLGIICYVITGFFTYAFCLMSFIPFHKDGVGVDIAVAVFLSLPAAMFLLFAHSLRRFVSTLRDTGLTLLSGAAMALLVVSFFVLVQLSPPEVLEAYYGEGTRSAFETVLGRPIWGSMVLGLTAAVGGALVFLGQTKAHHEVASEAQASPEMGSLS